jgi:hypothetical protein
MVYERDRFDRRSNFGRLISYPLILVAVIVIQILTALGD